MAVANNQTMEKQLTISGEQLEDIVKKSAEIDKNTAEIDKIKKALAENGGSIDLTEITARVDKLEVDYTKLGADYTKLNDLVVTNAADIATNEVRLNNFKETTKPLEEAIYTQEETDNKINEKVAEIGSNYEKLNGLVVTNSADIASNETRLNNFRNTTKPIEEVTYTKEETDSKITEKVSALVSGAPEDFNTLKKMSDWLVSHENSAATMNSAIQENTAQISKADAEITELENDVTDLKNQSSWRLIPTEFSTMADYILTLPVGKHQLFFRNASDTHITDMPTNANMFIEVLKYSNTTIRVNAYPSRQIADTIYSRSYSGGTWGIWYKFAAVVEEQVTAE